MYKQLPQKDVQNLEKQESKKQLSGYKQCYTYKNQSFEVSNIWIWLLLHATNSILEAKPPYFSKVVYTLGI